MMKVYMPVTLDARSVRTQGMSECYKCSEPQMVLAKWISVSTRKCQKERKRLFRWMALHPCSESIEHMKITVRRLSKGALSEALRSEGVFHPAAGEDGIRKMCRMSHGMSITRRRRRLRRQRKQSAAWKEHPRQHRGAALLYQ